MMSHEQSKEHIATNINLILWFKPALYSGTLVIKVVKSCIKPEILLQH